MLRAGPEPTPESLDAAVAAFGDVPLERSASLAALTTFKIGGPADLLVTARHTDDVQKALQIADELDLPVFLLGGGSNLLISDQGIAGLVLRLGGDLARLEIRDQGTRIDVGTGLSFPRLTKAALDLGWASAVGWMGTPGQVGGALIMNAGSRHGEIGDVVVEVHGVSARERVTIPKKEAGFAYRRSDFPSRTVLTSVRLQCDDPRNEEISKLKQHARDLLKKRHASQPKQRSAGSIFKNPDGDYAGRLIEEAGLKGTQEGGAMISDVHANFIVNLGGATSADVVTLASRAQARVQEKFGVALQWEVRRAGRFTAAENGKG
jgi:UDP-N-acetylmuramate dehydrogenase